MQQQFATALQFYRDGKHSAAAQMCREILAADANQPDALHLFGIMHLRSGALGEAVQLIGRATALRPNSPDYFVDLAEAHRLCGHGDRAVECCQSALNINAKNPAAWNTLGLSLLDLERRDEAADAFRQALDLRPEFAAAHNNLGVALLALSQADSAREHFRRAVDLAPEFAPARVNLGRSLLAAGHAKEALPHSQAAVRLQPNNADAHNDLGNVLAALKQTESARSEYLEAIRLAPTRPVAHANLGRSLREEDRLIEAVACMKAAAELDPNNASYWDELANLHWETDAATAAIACWERTLALDPNRVAARNSLGWALYDEGRLAEADECYLTALRIQPDFAPAHLNHGVYLEEKGELAEAEDAYREAIRLQPGYALALARLATLLRGKLTDADLAAIDACLANPQLHDGPRARLLFALAHVVEARGDIRQTADCLRQANAISLKENRRRGRAYDSAAHDRFVDGLIAGFGTEWFARIAGAGLTTRRPIFILGLPRSGTTLLEQILASHPAVHGAGELFLGSRGFELIPTYLERSEPPVQCLNRLDHSTIQRMAEQHLELLNRLAADRVERIVDKMPDNYLYLGWLATLFPNAAFIHCRRDFSDIAFSCWMTDFRSLRWANDVDHIAARFRAYRRLMVHWKAVCPAAIHEVRYEETVADLENVARLLVEICGLEWDPACLEFHRTQRTVRTASVIQVRQPIYGTSVARWKKFEEELADLFVAVSDP